MNSPFTRLLSTNHAPTNEEVGRIRQFLVEPTNQRNILEAEVIRLQGFIKELDDGITQHLRLLAPIHRAPPEILQEIFIHCLPTTHNSIMNSKEAPLLLGRVCRAWRNLSTAMPILWSSIHVTTPMNGHASWVDSPLPTGVEELHNSAVLTWLGRSGSLPLSISVHQPRSVLWKLLLPTLIQFSHRWKHIHLTLHPPAVPYFANLTAQNVPLLTTLEIKLPLGEWTPLDIIRAPQLRTLISTSSKAIPLHPEFSRLTSLYIEPGDSWNVNLSDTIAMDILSNCRDLIHCCLTFGWDSVGLTESQASRVPLLSLETLIVYESTGSNRTRLFDCLDLPALQHLQLSRSIRPSAIAHEPVPHSSLNTLLSKVRALKTLQLTSTSVDRNSLIQYIQKVPYITRLSFLRISSAYDLIFDNEVLGFLTPTDHSSPCPHMKILECTSPGFSDRVLLEFILARTQASIDGVEHLKHVQISFPREMETDIMPDLVPVTSAGTEVTLHYHCQHHHWTYNAALGIEEETSMPVALGGSWGHLPADWW